MSGVHSGRSRGSTLEQQASPIRVIPSVKPEDEPRSEALPLSSVSPWESLCCCYYACSTVLTLVAHWVFCPHQAVHFLRQRNVFYSHRTCSVNICWVNKWRVRYHSSTCAVCFPGMPFPCVWLIRSNFVMTQLKGHFSPEVFPAPPSHWPGSVAHCPSWMSPLHLELVPFTSSGICELLKGRKCV